MPPKDGKAAALTEYEEKRAERIADNKRKLDELKVTDAADELASEKEAPARAPKKVKVTGHKEHSSKDSAQTAELLARMARPGGEGRHATSGRRAAAPVVPSSLGDSLGTPQESAGNLRGPS